MTEIWVPDNLKSGVTSPCRYEPGMNPTYQVLARHYRVAVVPARVRKAKDKAKVGPAAKAALLGSTFMAILDAGLRLTLSNRPGRCDPDSRGSSTWASLQ